MRRKLNSTASTTTTTAPTPEAPRTPKKPTIPFLKVEPSNKITALWLGELDLDEGERLIGDSNFYWECIGNSLDPLWAYRYLYWKLGKPSTRAFFLGKPLPDPAVCTEVVLRYLGECLNDTEEGEA